MPQLFHLATHAIRHLLPKQLLLDLRDSSDDDLPLLTYRWREYLMWKFWPLLREDVFSLWGVEDEEGREVPQSELKIALFRCIARVLKNDPAAPYLYSEKLVWKEKLTTLAGGVEPALERLFHCLPHDLQVAWYPSAGGDFRDILYWQYQSAVPRPHLFIHTDYIRKDYEGLTALHQDQWTTIQLLRCTPLFFLREAGPDIAADLLHLNIQSHKVGCFQSYVLYCYGENLHFLDFLLQEGLHVSHLTKVREGLGCGGNDGRPSISHAYLVTQKLGLKYFFVDEQMVLEAAESERLLPHYTATDDYAWEVLKTVDNWSDFTVKLLRKQTLGRQVDTATFSTQLQGRFAAMWRRAGVVPA